MFSSILTSILRITKSVKIPGGRITLGLSARQSFRSPPPRRVILK